MAYVEDYLEDWDDDESSIEVAEDDFLNDQLLEMLTSEDDWGEEWDDDESSESMAERRRYFPWRRYRRRRYPRRYGRYRSFRPVRGTRGAFIRTPAGTARVRFPKPLATQESVNARVKELKKEIASNAIAIKKLDSTVDKNTAILDKKINTLKGEVEKSQQQTQQMMMLSLLMPDELETIQFEGEDSEKTIIAHKFKKDISTMLPLLMMSGGLGGGDSSNSMVMALVLAEAFK